MTSKVAVITGAGSGIGRAVALALHKSGFSVVLAGRRAEASKGRILAGSERTLAVANRRRAARAVRRSSTGRARGSGGWTCCSTTPASARPRVPIEELTVEQWKSVVDVNLTGAFLCTQQAFRLMKSQQPQGGRIINNGSISAHAPRPHSAPYTATKHAITGLTKCIALDGRRSTSRAARSTSATPRPR